MNEAFSKETYKKRIIDKKIDKYLKNCGAICIEGPKWCGKTWTSIFHSNSYFYVGDPQNNFSNRELAINFPSLVLEGDKPRMIDEWQEVPALWDATRATVDSLNSNGAFILTGSSTPKFKGVLHSGIGRIVSIKMSTMSLFESGDSTGEISLKDICSGNFQNKMLKEADIKDLANLIIRGGWPRNINNPDPTILPRSYVEEIIKNDFLKNIDNQKYSSKRLDLILKSLARNESTTVSLRTIVNDIKTHENEEISKDTISKYIDALDRMFLFNNLEPFSPRVRSSLRVKANEKFHFCDPALAAAILNLNSEKLFTDLETFGFLFEGLVERDLKIYADYFDAKLYHYQNYDNDEIDAVIELDDGNWCAFEIKLGASRIEEAARNLNKIEQKLIQNGEIPPKVKCIICGISNAAYLREDGIYVVPITALKD